MTPECNCASGTAHNDGDKILETVREQNRNRPEPKKGVFLSTTMTKCPEQERWLKRWRKRRW